MRLEEHTGKSLTGQNHTHTGDSGGQLSGRTARKPLGHRLKEPLGSSVDHAAQKGRQPDVAQGHKSRRQGQQAKDSDGQQRRSYKTRRLAGLCQIILQH